MRRVKKKVSVILVLALIVSLFANLGIASAVPNIIPQLVFDKASYLAGDAVQLSLRLTNIVDGDKTNSVTFDIEYDSSAFELATGNAENDIVTGYLTPLSSKNDLAVSGSTRMVSALFVLFVGDTNLREGEDVLKVNFKVKNTATPGNKVFTLRPVDMLDSSNNTYTVNNHLAFTQTATVASAPSVVTSVYAINGAESITIPASGSTTSTYTATIHDQYDEVMAGQSVAWSLVTPVTGVSVNSSTGVVAVSSIASAGDFILKAASSTNSAIYKTKIVTLAPTPPYLASLVLTGADPGDLYVGKPDVHTSQFLTLTGKDQYNQPFDITNQLANIVWSSTNTSYVTLDGCQLNLVGAGPAQIRATLGTVQSNGISVTVASAPTVVAPTASMANGTYYRDQINVTLSAANGISIYYAVDPGATINWTAYPAAGGINITGQGSHVLKAKAVDTAHNNIENVSMFNYTLAQFGTITATPVPDDGYLDEPDVTLSSTTTADVVIKYIVNGTGQPQTYSAGTPIPVTYSEAASSTTITAWLQSTLEPANASQSQSFVYAFDRTYATVRDAWEAITKLATLSHDQLVFLVNKANEMASLSLFPDEAAVLASRGVTTAELQAVVTVLQDKLITNETAFKTAAANNTFSYFVGFATDVKNAIPDEIKAALASRGISQDVLLATALDVMQSGLDFFAVDDNTRGTINTILAGNGISAEDKTWLAGFGINFDNLQYFLSRLTASEKDTLQRIIELMSAHFVAQPTANLASGFYFVAKKVQLSPVSDATTKTYYVLQMDPTAQTQLPAIGGQGWTQFTGTDISLALGHSYRLAAYRARGADYSTIAVWDYMVEDIAPPTATPAAGIYAAAQSVALSTPTTQAAIYYTLDGTDPKTSGTRLTYSAPIQVAAGKLGKKDIKAVTFKNNNYSVVVSYSFEVLAQPVAVPVSGSQLSVGAQVSLAARNDGAQILWTTGAGSPDKIYSGPITLTAGNPVVLKALVRKNGVSGPTATFSYTVLEKGTVQGTITNDLGQPITGVKVSVDNTSLAAITGVNGTYTIVNVPIGSQTVRTYNSLGYTDETLPVNVAANPAVATADFELSRGGVITGKVEDKANGAGDGLNGIRVYIGSAQTGEGRWGEATTGNDGSFRIENLVTASDYTLRFFDPSNTYLEKTVTGVSIVKGSVFSGGTYELDSVASQQATISGTITNEIAAAQAGIHVAVWGGPNYTYLDTVTDNNGAYTLAGLTPGSGYELFVWSDTAYLPLQNPDAANNIILSPQENETVNLVVITGMTVTGYVYNLEDPAQKLGNVDISVWSPTTYGSAWTKTDVNGNFTLSNLPPADNYQLYTYNTQFYLNKEGETVSITQNLNGLGIGLQPGRSITGKVVGSNLIGIPGARISAWSTNGGWSSGTSDNNGNFTLLGMKPDSNYTLYVWKQGYKAEQEEGIDLSTGNQVLVSDILMLGENEQVTAFSGAGNSVRVLSSVPVGGMATVRVDYKNTALIAATDTIINALIPEGTTYTENLSGRTFNSTTKTLSIPAGSVNAGASGTLTFHVNVGATTEATQFPIGVTAVSGEAGNRATDSIGVANIDVIHTDIQAPAVAAANSTITLSGRSSANADIIVYGKYDDGMNAGNYSIIGRSKADGKWWSLKAPITNEGTYSYYAMASVAGTSSRQSDPVSVKVDAAVPVLNSVEVKAGWNDWISTNPHTGVPAMAAAQGHRVYVQATFSGAAPDGNSVKMTFNETDYDLQFNNDTKKFEGQFDIPYTVFGEMEVEISYRAQGGLTTYTLPFIQLLILIDPSGNVSEEVPGGGTKPLQGVTAIAEYEQSPGVWVTWDAAKYGQVNPQTTDESGKYGWDVPAGNYRVVFSKANYQTYVSEVVVVPPPKTDLNPVMINLDKLVVPNVVAMVPSDGAGDVPVNQTVTVEFSKTMDEAAVEGNITIAKGGDAVAATVSYDAISKIATIDPAADLEFGVPYTVTVGPEAVDTWGNSIGVNGWAGSFTTIAPVTFGVIEIRDAGGNLRQALQGGNIPETLTLTGTLFLNGDRTMGANKAITLAISKDGQQKWTQNTTTDANGDYSISGISISGWADGIYAVTGLYGADAFQPADLEVLTVAAPEATPAAGTFTGSQSVTMTTDTNGAEIYYTISTSGDPADPTTLSTKYTGAITVGQTSKIKARAYLRGVYSPVAGSWTYTISTPSFPITPTLNLTTLEVSGGIGSLKVGDTFDLGSLSLSGKNQFGGDYDLSGKAVTWSSSDSNVASVSGSTLTAKTAGTANITATVAGITSNSIDVTVAAAATTKEAVSKAADEQIAKGAASVTITVAKEDLESGIEVDGATLAKLAEAGMSLIVVADEVTITIPAAALQAGASDVVTVAAVPVAANDAKQLTGKLSSQYKVGSDVVELTATKTSGTATSKAAFEAPVTVSISYNGMQNVNEDKLGAYYYNETTEEWEFVGGKVNKTAKTVEFNASHFSKYAVMAYEKTFGDMVSHWAKAEVELMAAKHIINGVSENEFAPKTEVTRAEFAAMLVRALGLKADLNYQLAFTDVAKTKWYYGEVAVAVKAGIINGISLSQLAPEAKITREQMAAMITRALATAGKKSDLTDAQVQQKLAKFEDSGSIAGWAKTEVAKATELGIIKGRTETTFVPRANATRAEAAVMINRMYVQLP